MAKLASVDSGILDISESNYLNWRLDLKFHLRASNLLPTITMPNEKSDAEKAKAMIYIRSHIDKSLKTEYLIVEDPAELWFLLYDRYDHQKLVILPRARYVGLNFGCRTLNPQLTITQPSIVSPPI